MQIKTLFEDSYILVVDKPSGLTVNTSQTSGDITLQNLVASQLPPEDPSDEETGFVQRKGIVHRLDKDTSGVLLVAKTEEAFNDLQAQFKNREVEKEYKALVIGKIEDELFEINAPIKRNPRNRLKYAVVAGGKEAETVFEKDREVTVDSREFTFLNVRPKTGRTHQIRVHLAAYGHPVVGDEIYCTRKQLEENQTYFKRLMLHASKIAFKHPITHEKCSFEAPLPDEFVIY